MTWEPGSQSSSPAIGASTSSDRARTIEVDHTPAQTSRQPAVVDEGRAMRAVELALHVEFPTVPVEHVAILVECLWRHFDGAPVRDFVPLLVRKQAGEELLDHLDALTGAAVSHARPASTAHP
jgi:hypothetical protein